MTGTSNPVLQYMHHKRWRWVTNAELRRATGCDQDFIDETIDWSAKLRTIEVNDAGSYLEYRYIGNPREPKRVAVEYLRRIYPQTATTHRISYETKVDIPPTLQRFTDLLPVERVEGNYPIARYRYVPNDRRSLLEPKPAVTLPSGEDCPKTRRVKKPQTHRVKKHLNRTKNCEQLRADIMAHLITSREWCSADDLVKTMRASNVWQVAGQLRTMIRNNYPIETYVVPNGRNQQTLYHYTGVAA